MWVWWIGEWEMMAADIVLRGPIPLILNLLKKQ
jgi:hypothetical protein